MTILGLLIEAVRRNCWMDPAADKPYRCLPSIEGSSEVSVYAIIYLGNLHGIPDKELKHVLDIEKKDEWKRRQEYIHSVMVGALEALAKGEEIEHRKLVKKIIQIQTYIQNNLYRIDFIPLEQIVMI